VHTRRWRGRGCDVAESEGGGCWLFERWVLRRRRVEGVEIVGGSGECSGSWRFDLMLMCLKAGWIGGPFREGVKARGGNLGGKLKESLSLAEELELRTPRVALVCGASLS